MLLAVSAAIGIANASSMLPWALVTGQSAFWNFPAGIFPVSYLDMAQALVGYDYFLHAPWHIPVLEVAPLAGGTNVFWLDTGPLLAIAGKIAAALAGHAVNLYGPYLYLCFVLPGVAMSLVLALLGQRSLVVTIAASILANATPYLLYRWGHITLTSQFFLVFALALYLWSGRRRLGWRETALWAGYLALVLFVNFHLLAMVGGIWAAALAQQRIDRRRTMPWIAAQAVPTMLALIALFALLVPLGHGFAMAGTLDYGKYQMDLLSPVMPQNSGIVPPPYNAVWLHTPEGFAYLGAGVFFLLILSARSLWRAVPRLAARHPALLVVFALFFLFALSSTVRIGNYPLLEIPLPRFVQLAFGTFRSSGRFFWPLGYGVVALAIVTTARRWPPLQAALILAVAAFLQWADTRPLRAGIADSAAGPFPTVLDRAQLERLVSSVRAVMVYPSFDCAMHDESRAAERIFDLRANMQLQLQTARANIPINSVYTSRAQGDCGADQATRDLPPAPGTLYVFLGAAELSRLPPATSQLACEAGRPADDGATPAALFCREGG